MHEIDFEKENLAIEKINERLAKFKAGFVLKWIECERQLFSNVAINGKCIGRRYWDDTLQLVNEYDYSNVFYLKGRDSNVIDSMYGAFKGLASQTLDELLVKLDLNDI